MQTVLMTVLALFFAVLWVSAQTDTTSSDAGKVNPSEILISHFLFARPDNWKWVETRSDVPNVVQSVTFEVNFPEGSCRAYFNHFKPNKPAATRKSVAKRWQDSFVDAPPNLKFAEPKTIGTNRISYIKIVGTFQAEKGAPLRRSFGLDGALIDDSQGNIVIRLMGSAAIVEKGRAAFHEMLENALRSEQ